jgi:FAD:protein FMN transferase
VIRLEQSARAMGTTFSLHLYGPDDDVLRAAADQAFAEVHRLDKMLSNYLPNSELNRVNAHAANGPVRVSRELFDLLTTCVKYSRESEGSFDITVGPLMKVWSFYQGSGSLPRDGEICAALEAVGYRHIEFQPRDLTVRFTKHGVNLDPGGVGKGYAVDKMAAILRKAGVCSGVISAAGSAIYAIGAPPSDANGWSIHIRAPEGGNEIASQVCLKDASLSTSGSLEKYFWHRGKRYSHIMDPRTGYPSEGMLSVSVIAQNALDTEVWAKPYYVLGRAWTERHRLPGFRVFMCEDTPAHSSGWLSYGRVARASKHMIR